MPSFRDLLTSASLEKLNKEYDLPKQKPSKTHNKNNRNYSSKEENYDEDYREGHAKSEYQTHLFLKAFYQKMMEYIAFEDEKSTPLKSDQTAGSDEQWQFREPKTFVLVIDEKAKDSQLGNEAEEKAGLRRGPTQTFGFEVATGIKGIPQDKEEIEKAGGDRSKIMSLGSFMKFSEDENFKDESIITDYLALIAFNDVDCKNYTELTKDNINKVTVTFIRPDELWNLIESAGLTGQQVYDDALKFDKEFTDKYFEITESEQYKTDPEYKKQKDKELDKMRRHSLNTDKFNFTYPDGQKGNSVYYYASYGKPDVVGYPVTIVVKTRELEMLPHTRVFTYDKREKEPFKEKDIHIKGKLKEKLPFEKRIADQKEIETVDKKEKETEMNLKEMKKEAENRNFVTDGKEGPTR